MFGLARNKHLISQCDSAARHSGASRFQWMVPVPRCSSLSLPAFAFTALLGAAASAQNIEDVTVRINGRIDVSARLHPVEILPAPGAPTQISFARALLFDRDEVMAAVDGVTMFDTLRGCAVNAAGNFIMTAALEPSDVVTGSVQAHFIDAFGRGEGMSARMTANMADGAPRNWSARISNRERFEVGSTIYVGLVETASRDGSVWEGSLPEMLEAAGVIEENRRFGASLGQAIADGCTYEIVDDAAQALDAAPGTEASAAGGAYPAMEPAVAAILTGIVRQYGIEAVEAVIEQAQR